VEGAADVNAHPVLDRHEKIALSFSGGKDSLACVHLLRDHLHRICIYHVDTGDLLPEMQESVATVEAFAPHFVRIETHVDAWIAANGLPTDLLPYSAHPVGQLMGEGNGARLVPRYDCCWNNLMVPLFARVVAEGCTLLVRGTKRADMRRLPATSGDVYQGVELCYPLLEWSNADVFAYLAEKGVTLPRIYDHVTNSPECARCSAWWGEGRGAYLKRYHPALWQQYQERLAVVRNEIFPSLLNLNHEAGDGT
jgi:3'-phosphoadenosine 5'-phosphosulfate sulfotransferase (PAPS reductase)/FAD synthetase